MSQDVLDWLLCQESMILLTREPREVSTSDFDETEIC